VEGFARPDADALQTFASGPKPVKEACNILAPTKAVTHNQPDDIATIAG
jgi:hypothetical protein